ncbi:Hypothetical protein, putative [Bodo saltans]|uniref:Uncharacterized protein n=1 Tax=Bodo saltans TaxID=75058 RepID=A0A0S4IU41_BODSA|nr:Hypothetical protein, putative [Bodo saltans]|eukprot:CUF93764.1 Hypothetical protein, putative [Bodo saltans]
MANEHDTDHILCESEMNDVDHMIMKGEDQREKVSLIEIHRSKTLSCSFFK